MSFLGHTIEGETLFGVAEFSHLVPDPPVILTPPANAVVGPGNVVVSWEPVVTPDGVEIEVYWIQLFPIDPPEGQEPIDLNIGFVM